MFSSGPLGIIGIKVAVVRSTFFRFFWIHPAFAVGAGSPRIAPDLIAPFEGQFCEIASDSPHTGYQFDAGFFDRLSSRRHAGTGILNHFVCAVLHLEPGIVKHKYQNNDNLAKNDDGRKGFTQMIFVPDLLF